MRKPSEGIDGCPTFAPAYVGRKRRAKPNDRFCCIDLQIPRFHNYPATVDCRTISFGSTKAVCGASSGVVANVSTRRAAASPMRSID